MPSTDVTQLLVAWKAGDRQAMEQLTPIVYDELRRLARRYLRDERNAATLQPTALVHEVYLSLVAGELPDWESRAHFLGIAAQRWEQHHQRTAPLRDHIHRDAAVANHIAHPLSMQRAAEQESASHSLPHECYCITALGCLDFTGKLSYVL